MMGLLYDVSAMLANQVDRLIIKENKMHAS